MDLWDLQDYGRGRKKPFEGSPLDETRYELNKIILLDELIKDVSSKCNLTWEQTYKLIMLQNQNKLLEDISSKVNCIYERLDNYIDSSL